jgi:hypothetical protein
MREWNEGLDYAWGIYVFEFKALTWNSYIYVRVK